MLEVLRLRVALMSSDCHQLSGRARRGRTRHAVVDCMVMSLPWHSAHFDRQPDSIAHEAPIRHYGTALPQRGSQD